MFKSLAFAFAALVAVPLTTAGQANAFPLGSAAKSFSQTETAGRPPIQFQIFCMLNPQDCRNSAQKVVVARHSVMSILTRVNSSVNREIIPRNEASDTWTIASRYGDCDDYVMTKRHRLIKAGIPASALRVAAVRTSWGEGHAVLLVKTTAGEFVLDNLRRSIMKREQSNYRYLSVQSANARVWNS
jgi:predicted transglutaminase-like cysteine proteinase